MLGPAGEEPVERRVLEVLPVWQVQPGQVEHVLPQRHPDPGQVAAGLEDPVRKVVHGKIGSVGDVDPRLAAIHSGILVRSSRVLDFT
jgi:hypothetical protein